MADPHTRVGQGGEMIFHQWPSHLENAPRLAREARGRHIGGLFKVVLQFIGGEGVELSCGVGGRVVGLMRVNIAMVINKHCVQTKV